MSDSKKPSHSDPVHPIFEWIDCLRPPDPGTERTSGSLKILLKACSRIVEEHGRIFNGSSRPSPQEEEQHYSFYFGGSAGKSGDGKLYLEYGSHHWMAMALCVFAINTKYRSAAATSAAAKNLHRGKQTRREKSVTGLWNYLQTNPLEKQEAECRKCLEFSKRGTLSDEHRLAYESVLEAIVNSSTSTVEELGEHGRKNGFKATLYFLRGFIYLVMESLNQPRYRLSSRALDCFQAACEKEPGCYFWWHNTFLVIRSAQKDVRDEVILKQLLEYGSKAHDCAPEHVRIRTALCLIWAGIERASFKRQPYWNTETWSLLLSVQNSLNANSDPSQLFRKWATIKVAELFIRSGRKSERVEDELRGKEILEECLVKWPDSHLVLGALAQLYDWGTPTGSFVDKAKALDLSNRCRQNPKTKAPLIFHFNYVINHFELRDTAELSRRRVGGAAGDNLSQDLKDCSKIVSDFKVECSPVWAADYLDRLPKYNVQKFPSTPDYLRCRLSHREFSLPDYLTQECAGAENPVTACETEQQVLCLIGSEEWICTKICVASVSLLLKRRTQCAKILESCKRVLKDKPEMCLKRHRQVYEHLLKSAELCTKFLHFKTQPRSRPAEEARLNQEIIKLKREWEEVKNSAVVQFVRGRLAALMGLVHDISLDRYRKAANLEPDNVLWQQMLYEKLKQMRSSGSNQNYPSTEELKACRRAHELSSGNVKYTLDLATVRMQDLAARVNDERHKKDGQTIREAEAISKLLGEVLKQSSEDSRYHMLAKLKRAELYTARGLPERTSEATEIFMECYRKWPKCSMVLHKVAKFYHHNRKLYPKARQIYEEAMQVAPANYPCLMDYLKLYGRYLKKYDEMVAKIDRSLLLIKDPEHVVNLLIIKGQALWLQADRDAKKLACEAWLEAFHNFHWIAFKVRAALTSPESTVVFGRLDLSLAELCHLFKAACERQKIDISKNKELKEFVHILDKAEEFKRSSNWRHAPEASSSNSNYYRRRVNSGNDNSLHHYVSQEMDSRSWRQ